MNTILVIEDDETIRNNLLEILEFEGFRAIGAEDGRMGLCQAITCLPDLILCDIRMPEFDGYQVLSALRSSPQTTTIPVIFLTAKSEPQDVRQGMNLGADDYLIKPCTIGDLLAAISSRLEKQAVLTKQVADAQRQAAQAFEQRSHYDSLTQLPTRGLLVEFLESALHSANSGVTVICVNIQRFHTINASFGHAVGDILLQTMAQRLKALVSEGLLARLNGDQFGIVLPGVKKADLSELMKTLLDAVTAPYEIQGDDIRIRASIGITQSTESTQTPQDLLTQAETAQHWCQQSGNGGYRSYSATLDELEIERRLIEMDLSRAIERAEFQVYYQPQIDLKTGQIVGLESLLRWNHPKRGMISPATFIPIAEELGLIVPLGEWVLRTACQQAKLWQSLSAEPIQISVNLSMRQFQQDNLLERVTAILTETGLDPKLLALELTESCLMHDVESTIHTLRGLKRLGIEISIDDFGTGYSSLNYLNQLPIDSLKIDRAFVRQITEGATAVSSAIIDLAKRLNLSVVAEGIETQNQLAFFRDQGCHLMQGFLYSPPVPEIEVQGLLMLDRRLMLASA